MFSSSSAPWLGQEGRLASTSNIEPHFRHQRLGGDVRISSSSIAPWLGQEGRGPEDITSTFSFQ